MGVGLLAPVPAIIIESALKTSRREGAVAFATNAVDVFAKLETEFGPGLSVIIQPSARDGDPHGYARKTLSAKFVKFQLADRRTGLHPDAAKRPDRVFDPMDPDTPALGFWEVAGLRFEPERMPLTIFKALGKKTFLPPGYKLHGPILVTADHL